MEDKGAEILTGTNLQRALKASIRSFNFIARLMQALKEFNTDQSISIFSEVYSGSHTQMGCSDKA